MYSDISYQVDEAIATISLDRPEARNGYTLTMADELIAALTEADTDPEVRVVVLTGSGKDFCVGADLSGGSFDTGSGDGSTAWQEPAGRCSKKIYELNKPVIAALRGAAVGAGSTIILSCDYRLASTDSRFGYVFSRRGIYPEGGSTWYLPRLVGLGTAFDWLVSGRLIPADEALAAGLVSALYDPEKVLEEAYTLARDLIATTSPVSVAVIRQMLLQLSGLDSPYPAHLCDSQLISKLGTNADAFEGVTSFLQKRAPNFPLAVPADLPDWKSAAFDENGQLDPAKIESSKFSAGTTRE